MSVLRGLVVLLAGTMLASCMAHGPGKKFDPGAYVNHKLGSEAFYRELMTGRVWLFSHRAGKFRNIVHGLVYAADGRVIECWPGRVDGKLFWIWVERRRWSVAERWAGVRTRWDITGEGKRHSPQYYDPETGDFTTALLRNGKWTRTNSGVIQDTWPRVLADGCARLKLPADIRINEKQTSPRMDELRQQDPDAPIRNFAGSARTDQGVLRW